MLMAQPVHLTFALQVQQPQSASAVSSSSMVGRQAAGRQHLLRRMKPPRLGTVREYAGQAAREAGGAGSKSRAAETASNIRRGFGLVLGATRGAVAQVRGMRLQGFGGLVHVMPMWRRYLTNASTLQCAGWPRAGPGRTNALGQGRRAAV